MVQGIIRRFHLHEMLVETAWMWIDCVDVYKSYDQLKARETKSAERRTR